jgi:outer membrane protein assembly factor BamB
MLKFQEKNMRLFQSLFIILFSTCVVSCASIPFLGKSKKLNLPGERVKLSTTKSDLIVEEKTSKADIVIPEAKVNDGWYKSSGITSSQIGNLYLNTPLQHQASFEVAHSGDFTLGSTPVIVGNKIFVSSSLGTIDAFDLQTGASLWSNDYYYKLQGGGRFDFFSSTYLNGGLAFSADTLYATGGLAEVIALKPENGELIWRAKLSSPARSTPLPINNLVIVQTIDNKIFALDVRTGKIMWHHNGISEDLSILATYAPAISGNNVIVQYSSGEIYALNANTGEEVWTSNISSQTNKINTEKHLSGVITSPTVDKGLILAFGSDGTLAALKENGGDIVWKKDIGINKQFWVSGNIIFAITNDNKLVCLDKASGKLKWISDLFAGEEDADTDIFYGSPVVANSKVMLIASNGKLLSYDAKTGHKEPDQSVSKEVYLMPVIANGNLFLLDNSGHITRYGK